MSLLAKSFEAMKEELREGYAALNRNDVPAMLENFDPQVEWTEWVELPIGGTYKGIADLKAHLLKAREGWAEGSCEPEEFILVRDRVVVFVYVRVRLKHEAEWREGELADVYTYRAGKVIHVRVFADRKAAMEWAEVEGSATT